MSDTLVYAIYPDGLKASEAVERLHAAGFSEVEAHPITEADEKWISANPEKNSDSMKTVYAGTAVGLGVGEMLGLAVGWGIGPAFALGAAAAGGAAGGAAGAMIGNALGDRDQKLLKEYKDKGGVLLKVRCTPDTKKAAIQTLEESGAVSTHALDSELPIVSQPS